MILQDLKCVNSAQENQSTFYCVSTRMPRWCTRNIVEISTAWNTIFVYPFFYFFWTSQHTHTIFYCHSAWPGTLPTASLVPLSSNLLTWIFSLHYSQFFVNFFGVISSNILCIFALFLLLLGHSRPQNHLFSRTHVASALHVGSAV